MKLFHGLRLEGNCAVKHGKQYNTHTPDINIESVAFVSEDLWCDICWSAALLTHNLVWLNLPRYAKICNFDVTFAVK